MGTQEVMGTVEVMRTLEVMPRCMTTAAGRTSVTGPVRAAATPATVRRCDEDEHHAQSENNCAEHPNCRPLPATLHPFG